MFASLTEVMDALEGNRIVPYFQPIVEIKTGQLVGFEVLARWLHPELGAILPENFIQLAEENGLIGALAEQVFRGAFQAAPKFPEPLTFSLNISPIQLTSDSLARDICALAQETGFPLNRLVVEITESALMKDLARVQASARALKEAGCTLALDDFGTGYSSLRHLQALPFDQLKIDRSFVSEMTRKRESRKIVAAIVGLGQSLGLTTVAEGVETAEQAQMLLWLGCELGQGWRYGRPGPAEGLAEILRQGHLGAVSGLSTPGDDWASSSLEALPTLRLAQLQAIYDGAPVGLCFLDRKMRYLNLNKRLADMNGATVEEHLGRSVQEMLPAMYPAIEPYLLRAFSGEAIAGVEVTHRSHHPEMRDLRTLVSYQPAWDEADEVIGVSVSVLDITEARVPLDHLERDAGQESARSETNPEEPWVMDAEGNDLHASSRWVRTTPLGKDKTRNLKWLEALHTDDLEQVIAIMREAMLTGKPIDIEYRVVGVNGDWRWMRSTGAPRFGASGEITRWYGSVEDIQDRRAAEEALLAGAGRPAEISSAETEGALNAGAPRSAQVPREFAK